MQYQNATYTVYFVTDLKERLIWSMIEDCKKGNILTNGVPQADDKTTTVSRNQRELRLAQHETQLPHSTAGGKRLRSIPLPFTDRQAQ